MNHRDHGKPTRSWRRKDPIDEQQVDWFRASPNQKRERSKTRTVRYGNELLVDPNAINRRNGCFFSPCNRDVLSVVFQEFKRKKGCGLGYNTTQYNTIQYNTTGVPVSRKGLARGCRCSKSPKLHTYARTYFAPRVSRWNKQALVSGIPTCACLSIYATVRYRITRSQEV